MKKILVVAAHPDDEVLGCGGTLAKLCASGACVHLAFLADGVGARRGPQDREGDALHAELHGRRTAAEAAAGILGAASVSFISADGKEYALLLGNTTPTGSNVYAAVEGDTSTVYMASTQVKIDADQGLFYWRLKNPEVLDEAKTTKIVSNIRDKRFVLEKDQSGAWQLASPVKEPGKKERIASFIMNFRFPMQSPWEVSGVSL